MTSQYNNDETPPAFQHEGLLLLLGREPVFSNRIVGFLDRASVLKVLQVTALRDTFALTEYYCDEHGTALALLEGYDDDESEDDNEGVDVEDKEEEKEELPDLDGLIIDAWEVDDRKMAANADKLDIAKEENKDNKEEPPKKLRCIDCVEAENGNERCPRCDEFEYEDYIFACSKCLQVACDKCGQDDLSGWCESCDNYFCGRGECPPVFWCDGCEIPYCLECSSPNVCEKCGFDHGCLDCAMHSSYMCGACDNLYCDDCEEHYWCGSCEECYCRSCRKSYFCYSCETPYCCGCREKAGECDKCQSPICGGCAFKCSECETMTCKYGSCTKAYSCTDCKKKICSDCQDVFETCCCEKKGTFALVPKPS